MFLKGQSQCVYIIPSTFAYWAEEMLSYSRPWKWTVHILHLFQYVSICVLWGWIHPTSFKTYLLWLREIYMSNNYTTSFSRNRLWTEWQTEQAQFSWRAQWGCLLPLRGRHLMEKPSPFWPVPPANAIPRENAWWQDDNVTCNLQLYWPIFWWKESQFITLPLQHSRCLLWQLLFL